MATAIAFQPEVSPLTSEVSTTLSVGAGVAFEVFADIAQVPRWLPILQTLRACSIAIATAAQSASPFHAAARAGIARLHARIQIRFR